MGWPVTLVSESHAKQSAERDRDDWVRWQRGLC